MENFHWPPSGVGKLSYVLVTFRAAAEFIRGPDAKQYLPGSTEVGTTTDIVIVLG